MTTSGAPSPRDTTRRLPPTWRWVPLREVLGEAQLGFASGARDPSGALQLRMNNVTNRGQLDWSSITRVPVDPDTLAAYRLHPGDVLFNNTNSTDLVGKTALFEGHEEPVVFSNHFTRLRTSPDKLSPAFLAFWLQFQWRQRVFASICNRWIGQSAVQREKLLSLEIPLPSCDEQKRIAAILSQQMAAVERARAAAEAQLQAAKALPAAYLRAVFTSAEAQDWPKRQLGDILQPRKEVVHPRDNPEGRSTFVGLEHIESGTGIRVGCVEIEMSELTGRKPRFYKGDIVYGYLRPYLNKVWVAEFDGLCSVDQYVYAVNKTIADTTFVAWFMRSPVYLERAPIGTTPGQLPRIRIEEVAAVEVSLPPLREQRQTSIILAERMAALERLRKELEQQFDAINALPAALLRRAFSGGL